MKTVIIVALILTIVHLIVSGYIFFSKQNKLPFIPDFDDYNSSWLISTVVCVVIIILLATSDLKKKMV